MTGSNYLLDTSVVIEMLGGDRVITARIESLIRACSSPIILGELYYGAFHSTRAAANLAQVEGHAASVTVLPLDDETAREFGRIKSDLRRRGRPIPENDVWIAAVARRHGLTLATRDAPFREVLGLIVDHW